MKKEGGSDAACFAPGCLATTRYEKVGCVRFWLLAASVLLYTKSIDGAHLCSSFVLSSFHTFTPLLVTRLRGARNRVERAQSRTRFGVLLHSHFLHWPSIECPPPLH